MTLDLLPGRLAVCRLAPGTPLAPWMGEGGVSSISRTTAELSVVCAEASVPEGVRVEAAEGEWCRVAFVDRLTGQTRAGWVPMRVVRATGGGELSR